MKFKKITVIIASIVMSAATTITFSAPASAYIKDCPDTGIDSEEYYCKRCLTSSPNEGFQVSMTCVNIFQIGGTKYGNIARSGQISRVKCGFGTHPLTGELNYRTAAL
ncbi:MAG: hypothetical protein LBT19_01680 [Candidatus Nomurabacteria bacterium]|nr:hypothetical protein [Candidatus Nomurabacteria bacterium]